MLSSHINATQAAALCIALETNTLLEKLNLVGQ